MIFNLQQLQGSVGDSDLHGEMRVDASGARPRLSANLISHALDFADLAPSVGAGVPKTASPEADTTAPKKQSSDRLLPDYQFQFDRLRSMDASVELRADSVKTEKLPIQQVDLKLVLDKGVLTLEPADLTLPEGTVSGAIRVNATGSTAETHIDARLNNVKLDQFKGKKATEAPLEGDLLSRAQLEGHGNSVHDILASANGTIVAVIPRGEMRQAFAEFTGINAARGLGLLLTDSKKEDNIRCGIAVFNVTDGKAQAQPLVLDLDTVVVTGSGGFDFNSEKLNLRLRGQSKKFDPLHVRTPIILGGTLGKPSIGARSEESRRTGWCSRRAGGGGDAGGRDRSIPGSWVWKEPGLRGAAIEPAGKISRATRTSAAEREMSFDTYSKILGLRLTVARRCISSTYAASSPSWSRRRYCVSN